MSTSVYLVPGQNLAEELSRGFRTANGVGIAAAYVTSEGLGFVQASIESVLARQGMAHIVHGVDGMITQPGVVRSLNQLARTYDSLIYRVRLNGGISDRPLFHPKFYWYEQDGGCTTCVIGSSNLTRPGLTQNNEVNAVIRGGADAVPIQNCRTAFERLLADDRLFKPDGDFPDLYEKVFRKEQEINRRRQNNELTDLYADLDAYIVRSREERNQVRAPKTQLDVIVLAMRRAGWHRELHLRKIYARARSVAEEFDLQYDWGNWKNSVRGRINDNTTVNNDGKKLFVRVPGENPPSGIYRLSEIGWRFLDKR